MASAYDAVQRPRRVVGANCRCLAADRTCTRAWEHSEVGTRRARLGLRTGHGQEAGAEGTGQVQSVTGLSQAARTTRLVLANAMD